jgi:putative ABC transport system permease protein
MLLWETVRTALRALASNKLRTALTTLGMIIGVSAVVTMLALGEGARASVESNIRSMGSNLLSISPGSPMHGPVHEGSVNTLTAADADAIAELPGVVAVAPETMGTAQVRYLERNMSSSIIGTTSAYLGARAFAVASGQCFTDNDVHGRRRVAVIGSNVAETLFGNLSPLGERIQIKGVSFLVVGVLEEKGSMGFFNPDDQIIVPLTAHQSVLFGQDFLSSISVQVASEGEMNAVQGDIERLLRLRHRIREGADDDFHLRSQTEMLQTMNQVTGTFTALLGGVAAVSLLVGGIGIMNIMLVSVRERTREIGLRLAVGARRRDILLQFLVESVIVSLAGGLAGLALGYGAAELVARLAGWDTVIRIYSVVLALATSFGIGVIFGVGPARRAARMDPVEALRQE